MPTKFFAASALLLFALGAAAQPAPNTAWPRVAKGADGTSIAVYQPQIERWADNNSPARAAVAVTRPGEKDPHYGVIELTARTDIDKAADIATLSALRVTKTSFPGATEEEAEGYLATLRGAMTRQSWPVSVQALQANLAVAQARSQQKALPVKNDPPQILFRTTPSMLVLDRRRAGAARGQGRTRAAARGQHHGGDPARFVLVELLPLGARPLVAGEARWTANGRPARRSLAQLDRARDALGKNFDPLEGKDAEGKPLFDAGVTPQIIVASEADRAAAGERRAEVLADPGHAASLHVELVERHLHGDSARRPTTCSSPDAGSAPSRSTGRGASCRQERCRADFAKIPPSHPMADVLMSVPGTPQAREAAIANQIPQTATVQRDIQPTPVGYDGGQPQWKPIDGTPLSYAPNTGVAGDPRRREDLLHGAERRVVRRHRAGRAVGGGGDGARGDLHHPAQLADALRDLRARVRQHAHHGGSSAIRRATTAR